jgi:hypothetical protein
VDHRTLAERIENWRHSFQTQSDEELIEAAKRELGNSGWVQLKGYYLNELRDELHHRGLADTGAAQTLDRRVIFLRDTPDR